MLLNLHIAIAALVRGVRARDWATMAALATLYLAMVRPYYGITADDAYISFRYAQNWVAGCGPVFNCGEPAVEGYTNFLWTAMAAVVMALGFDAPPAMRLVGLLCGALAMLALAALARRLHRGTATPALAALVLASSPFWAVNTVSGLETAAATLSVLVATGLSMALPRARRPWAAGAAWGVSYLIRPEGLVLGFLTGVWILLAGLISRVGLRNIISQGLRFTAGFMAVGLPYFVWRVVYYGNLHPNTYYAKSVPLDRQLPTNIKILSAHPVFFVSLLAAALLVLVLRRELKLLLPLLLALGAAAISLTVQNNFWMPGHRLYLTATALVAALAAGLGDMLTPELPRWGAVGRLLRPLPTLGLFGALLYSAWVYQPETVELANLHYARDDNPARAMGERMRKKAGAGDWLLTRDAGMVPFYAGPGVKVLDIHTHSLNDRRIARQGWDLKYIMGHNPRWVIFPSTFRAPFRLTHPIEGRIYHGPGFHDRYREIEVAAWHRLRFFFLFEKADGNNGNKK